MLDNINYNYIITCIIILIIIFIILKYTKNKNKNNNSVIKLNNISDKKCNNEIMVYTIRGPMTMDIFF